MRSLPVIYLDFSKAFISLLDSLASVGHYILDGQRAQQMGRELKEPDNLACWSQAHPQAYTKCGTLVSVLGPVLFVTFTSDLEGGMEHAFVKFSGDTNFQVLSVCSLRTDQPFRGTLIG